MLQQMNKFSYDQAVHSTLHIYLTVLLMHPPRGH